MMPRFKAVTFILSLATLCTTAFAQSANQANSVNPGTLNYVEGQASIEGRPVTSRSVGSTTMQAGQVLATANGRAEVLLTPGIFVRLGDNSTIQMVSPDLTHTEIKLEQGHASVEVDQIHPQNTILIDINNGQTQLLKNGLYTFDAANSTVRVFNGKASVYPETNMTNTRPVEVKGDHQLVLTSELLKPQRFNKDQAEADQLYKWSSLRSDYLGEANLTLAEDYAGYPGFYPGWYWAGYGYTWLPGDGLFWSPFGYGFYSPFYLYGGGAIYGRGGHGGYPYHGGYAVRGAAFHGAAAGGAGFHGSSVGGAAFHGGAVGGAGVHGGGGGGGHR